MGESETAAGWERLRFVGRFLRHPRTVGAVAPSSRHLAAAMVAPMIAAPDDRRPRSIVELGAGTGSFTRAILDARRPGDRYLGIELDPVFASQLRRRWPAATFVCASADRLEVLAAEHGFDGIDHIVSGLPFATLPSATTSAIIRAIASALRPGGSFTTFHYVQSLVIPATRDFRRQMNGLMAAEPTWQFVAWNVTPAFALTWRRDTLVTQALPCDLWVSHDMQP